jgi:hypothetical protein
MKIRSSKEEREGGHFQLENWLERIEVVCHYVGRGVAVWGRSGLMKDLKRYLQGGHENRIKLYRRVVLGR